MLIMKKKGVKPKFLPNTLRAEIGTPEAAVMQAARLDTPWKHPITFSFMPFFDIYRDRRKMDR